jgi:hypothetical protein
MNTPVEMRPTQATVSAYERLRGRYLEPLLTRVDGELGLSVLLRQGMFAWTRTCSSAPNLAQASPAPLDNARVPAPLHHAIIDVMVSMATSVSRSVQPGVHRP